MAHDENVRPFKPPARPDPADAKGTGAARTKPWVQRGTKALFSKQPEHDIGQDSSPPLSPGKGHPGGPAPDPVSAASPPLIGREDEARVLRAAFESACSGRAGLVLVTGPAGTGKTFLVDQTLKALASSRGYFTAGKFDPVQIDGPYAPLLDALGDLLRRFLTGSSQTAWKRRLRRALEGNGAVLAAVLPGVQQLTGPLPPLEPLPPPRSANRFRTVFRALMDCLPDRRHPLVIFLDDLHWADPDSLGMIRFLAEEADLRHLLLVGASRNSVFSDLSPQMKNVSHIHLDNLDRNQTALFVAAALTGPAGPPADLLYRHTGGNPFFMEQLLRFLRREKPPASHPEKWPASVSDLLAARLRELPRATRTTLQQASCLGSAFDLADLAEVAGKTPAEAAADLSGAGDLILTLAAPLYQFRHDLVREAARSLLPEGTRQRVHLRAGRLSPARADQEARGLFRLAGHLNCFRDWISNPGERISLASRNLAAARQAGAVGAYAAAAAYGAAGRQLLPDDAWDVHYRLTRDIHLEEARAEYLRGHRDQAGQLFDALLRRSPGAVERAGILREHMALHNGRGKYHEALGPGLKALRELGLNLPARPGKATVLREIWQTRWLLRGRSYDDLPGRPASNDPVPRQILAVLAELAQAAHVVAPGLYAHVVCRGLRLSLHCGDGDSLGPAYIAYNVLAATTLGDWDGLVRAAQAAPLTDPKCGPGACADYLLGTCAGPWTGQGRAGRDYLDRAYAGALAAGDPGLMARARRRALETSWCLGAPIKDIQRDCRTNQALAGAIGDRPLLAHTRLLVRMTAGLKGTSPPDENGHAYNEGDPPLCRLLGLQSAYWSGRYTQALAAADEGQEDIRAATGRIVHAEYNFYQSLAITAAYAELPPEKKALYRNLLRRNQKQMKQWAGLAAHWEPRYLLVGAETARLEGRNDDAATLYDRAIQGCRENLCQPGEALANELAGRFYLACGRNKIARVYLADACRVFHSWGAAAKARALRSQYARLLAGITTDGAKYAQDPVAPSPPAPDPPPISRAARLLAEETDPARLLGRFLVLTTESAGADRGFLLTARAGRMWVQARREGASSPDLSPVPLERGAPVAQAVLRHVVRNLETVVLNDSGQTGAFRDPHLTPGRSVACLPLLFRGAPVAFLYLENTRGSGAFTPDRLEVLGLLAGQLAYLNKVQALLEENTARAANPSTPLRPGLLTEREREVLALVAAGLSNEEIAVRLRISVSTVKSHLLNSFGKLRVKRRTQAVSRARELQLFGDS